MQLVVIGKKKLESKFPELFKSTLYQNTLERVNEIGKLRFSCEQIKVEGDKVESYILVKVLLPNANNEWSLEAFKWVEKFMQKQVKGSKNTYIWHSSTLDNANFIHIKVM